MFGDAWQAQLCSKCLPISPNVAASSWFWRLLVVVTDLRACHGGLVASLGCPLWGVDWHRCLESLNEVEAKKRQEDAEKCLAWWEAPGPQKSAFFPEVRRIEKDLENLRREARSAAWEVTLCNGRTEMSRCRGGGFLVVFQVRLCLSFSAGLCVFVLAVDTLLVANTREAKVQDMSQ